jgi:hypothetical protein
MPTMPSRLLLRIVSPSPTRISALSKRAFAPEAREARLRAALHAAEERRECLVEAAQHLLLGREKLYPASRSSAARTAFNSAAWLP